MEISWRSVGDQSIRSKLIIGTGRGVELPYFKLAALRRTAARQLEPYRERAVNETWSDHLDRQVRELSTNPLVLNSIPTYISKDMSLASFSSLKVLNS